MSLTLNKLACRVSPHVLYFVSTTFLASIWTTVGFPVLKTLEAKSVVGIWLIYLGPVLFGYYLGSKMERLQNELNSLVDKNLGPQPTLQERRKQESELLAGLLLNNLEYRRIWWECATLALVFAFDIWLAVWLYVSGKV